MKYTIYLRFVSKKNIIICLILIALLFQGASEYNSTIQNTSIINTATLRQISQIYDDKNVDSPNVDTQIALQVEKYLKSERPISNLYEEPHIQDNVYNFLVSKVGSHEITETILFFIEKEKLPIETVFALVFTESKFKTNAINLNSHSKDFGLFQLNSRTFRHLTKEELFDLETNVMLGTQYLKYAYSLMNDTNKALAVYNAGPSRPLRGIIPVTTQKYIKKINIYTKILINEFSQYMRKKYSLADLEET